ncbi:MAG: 4-hydroxy-3-methylbut-2-enyl diphosphate reductase [Elusimicrobia bacterium]|nr:4-hydroxy-3-methylbut-2-enyl diphosphate reductase [Elusimicrobiota bacterium]
MNVDIIKGASCGFCSGVMRAIKLAREAAQGDVRVYTLGPVIHNPQVVESLEKSNIISVDDIKGLSGGDTVLIRSHGITEELEEEIRRKKLNIIDATCPKVKRAQRICTNLAENYSKVFIIGISEHPEVQGILSRGSGRAKVISSLEEAAKEEKFRDAGILVQTTYRTEKFYEIVSELLKKGRVIKIENTICEETITRQEEVSELSLKVDLMYVVGGKNSSNTKRLFESSSKNVTSLYIETPEEISPRQLTGKKRIGIVSGASTPIDTVNRIEERIKKELKKSKKEGKKTK